MYVCVCVYMYVYVYVYVYVCVYVYVYVYICMYVYVYICVCICIYMTREWNLWEIRNVLCAKKKKKSEWVSECIHCYEGMHVSWIKTGTLKKKKKKKE